MLGSRLTADEAASLGLVTKAVENEAFAAEVRGFSERLAKQAPIAIRLAKVLLNRATDTPIDASLEMEAMAFGRAIQQDLGQTNRDRRLLRESLGKPADFGGKRLV